METHANDWMIYGANGYTGHKIAQRAVAEGLRPILAGRDERRVREIAQELSCPYRIFSLASPDKAAIEVRGISAVLHCAGPFSETAEPMMEACLRSAVSYMDITGEIDVIELAASRNERAKAAGVSIMPSVGFDVVPSDCLAARLSQALPSATNLELAFTAISRVSPGTAKTMWAQLGDAGRVRKDGHIVRVPVAWKTADVPFPSGMRKVVTIPWGDVASAFHTTGIPNIQVSTALPPKQLKLLLAYRWMLPITRFKFIQWLGRQWISRFVKGPSESEREAGRAEFWGRVTDAQGKSAEATLVTPEGYSLTILTALEIAKRTLAGEVPPGFSTPAKAFGPAFIDSFPNVTSREVKLNTQMH